MIRRLIPAAALAALAAWTANPIAPASTHVSRDANPGIGSGAGIVPPNGDRAGQPGSGALFDQTLGSGNAVGTAPGDNGGMAGSGAALDAGPGIGAGVGIAAPADANTGQLGSGNEDPALPLMGNGN